MKLEDLVLSGNTAQCSFGALEVRGLDLIELSWIFVRFPELGVLANGGDIDPITLMSRVAPDALPAIIAAGCDMSGEAGEEKARKISASDQLRIISKIVDLTFPDGIDAFGAEIEEVAPADLQKAPAPSASVQTDLAETLSAEMVRA